MTEPRIKIDTDIAYERGWPTERFVAAIDNVWLVRKDGGLRKFKTSRAARKAAIAEIEKASTCPLPTSAPPARASA